MGVFSDAIYPTPSQGGKSEKEVLFSIVTHIFLIAALISEDACVLEEWSDLGDDDSWATFIHDVIHQKEVPLEEEMKSLLLLLSHFSRVRLCATP